MLNFKIKRRRFTDEMRNEYVFMDYPCNRGTHTTVTVGERLWLQHG